MRVNLRGVTQGKLRRGGQSFQQNDPISLILLFDHSAQKQKPRPAISRRPGLFELYWRVVF
jgi:hypothetical protein